MYIPEFLCGVIATLLAEVIGCIAGLIHLSKKYKDDNN